MRKTPRAHFASTIISLFLLGGVLLGACQPAVAPLSTLPASNASPLPPTATPTTAPSPTPTPVPLSLWIDPLLPSDFVKKINLPEGILASRNKDDADLFLTVSNPAKGELVLGETWQVYALAAPFFTVQDEDRKSVV